MGVLQTFEVRNSARISRQTSFVRNLGKVLGHIPARGGSKRLPAKNLRILDGKPMMAYAIQCALDCPQLSDTFVNTDSEEIDRLAHSMGVKVYRRPEELGSDQTTGDDFTADFIRKTRPDTLVMVSPVCPMVTAEDITNAMEAYQQSDCDTLITCEATQMQTFCEEKPVNIDIASPLAPSQLNPFVQILNWAVTIWDAAHFMQSYESRKSGYIGTNRLLYPIAPSHGIKVSTENDFQQAELLLKARQIKNADIAPPIYWSADGL